MLLLFIVVNFIISAVSDIGLNILSRLRTSPEAVRALKPYFQNHSLLISAGYAGITVVTVLVITMLISKLVFKFLYPKTIMELGLFLLLAVPIGYIADIIIYYFQIFGPTMNEYYKKAGAGFWGSAAFVFSIVISYNLSKRLRQTNL
jgi:hypothetical protein